MEKITNFKMHWVAMLFALLIAGFMVSPELIMQQSLGESFDGIYMHGSDGELFYLARMQQTYRDISAWDSPYLYEYRGEVPMGLALFVDPILAYPGKLLSISVPVLNLIYKTFFSGVIFLLIYFLMFRLTASIRWSITVAIFILTGYRLITLPGMTDFLRWHHGYSQFMLFSRPPTSQVMWILFWSFLHFLLSTLQKREWKYFIGCGIIFGLSFYTQYFLWTFLLALIGIIILGALLAKQKYLAVKTTAALFIGSIIALPYILNILSVMNHEYFSFYSNMVFLFNSREPNISKMGIMLAVLFSWYLWRSKERSIYDIFLLSLLVTTFVTTNQQLLTNRLLEVGHYHWFFNTFLYILILFYLARRISLLYNQKWVKFILVLMVILSFSSGYLIQSSSYAAQLQRVSSDQKYTPIFNWLNQNTSVDDVVFTNNDHLSLLLPVYTHNFVYWNSAAPLYMMPPERFETAVFMYLKLNDISPAVLGGESFFHSDANQEQLELASKYSDVSSVLYIQFRRAFQNGMLDRYESFYKEEWSENFQKYRLDYIVYEPAISDSWNLEHLKFLRPVKTFGDIVVYKNTLQ